MKPMLLSLLASLLSLPLLSMPTPQEIAAAEPLVQEVMKAEMDALRSGKKTREQVGDAALALAKAAQAPAEKYILLTGAFDYYMRGGAYDKAASALEAVRKAVPDWKGSDEFALIDKAMRVVAFGKGGPVRERYEELKERQQYAIRLRKALEQAKAKPSDKKLQFQVATYSAALDRWPQAVDAFLAANNPACAAAAKLEKESAPPAKIADAWWSVVDIRPAFLSSAIRAHAVDLYKKALDSNSLAGLQKVAAEKRIQEAYATESEKEPAAPTSFGKKSSKAYVQRGLVAQWDGIDNAGYGKHNAKATVWKDLVGNRDAKLSPDAAFTDKALSLEKSLSYATWTSEMFGGDFTMEFVVDGSACPGFNSIFVAAGDSWSLYAGGPETWVLKNTIAGARPTLTPRAYRAICIRSQAGKISVVYPDGKFTSNSVGLSVQGPVSARAWSFGGTDAAHRFNGKFYAVRYYNRALSDAELVSNHAIDKTRFGLVK